MSPTAQMDVRIDPRVRADPRLVDAIEASTPLILSFFTDPRVEPPEVAAWRFADPAGEKIEVTLSARTPPPGPTAKDEFWTRWMLDPVNRKYSVLEALRKFLHESGRLQGLITHRLITRAIEEEQNARPDEYGPDPESRE